MDATHPSKGVTLSDAERRRHPRYPSTYRLLVRWLECDECEEEIIRAEDLSRGGARLVLRRPLAQGEILFVTGWKDGFATRAEVRRVYIGRDGEAHVGVAFLDAEPPEAVFVTLSRPHVHPPSPPALSP
jgi:hypothetical protein